MKTFLKENIIYILIHLISFAVLGPIILFDNQNFTLPNYLYLFLLTSIVFVLGLIVKYISSKRLYKWLESDSTDLPSNFGSSSLSKSLERKMNKIVASNSEQISNYKVNYSRYLSYINRWVHQLKTPLSVLQLIYKENEENELIPEIQNETDKILLGLNTALYYARSEEFTNDLNFENLQLNKLVTDVVNDLKRWFIRSGVFPKVNIANDFEISTDEKWLKFIIYQLLTNAIKYSDKDDSIVEIKLEGNKLIIADQGMGIDKKDINRIFEQFYTGENGRIKGESTGVGLYLVKQICDKLKYPLSVESQKGIGTIITLTLH